MKYLLFTITLLYLILPGCQKHEKYYEHYAPLYFDGNGFAVKEDLMNKDHFDRVELVLRHYGSQYQRINDLTIKFSRPKGAESVFNITNKAEDSHWLRMNPPGH